MSFDLTNVIKEYEPAFLYNDKDEGRKVLTQIENELLKCDCFSISVAFITDGGIIALLPTLKQLEEKHIPGKILTTDYLSFSEPKALRRLHEFKNLEIKMYQTEMDIGFHTKVYIFEQKEIYRIIVGSSNMTQAALTKNKEWNLEFVSSKEDMMSNSIIQEFNRMWNSNNAKRYEDFISGYETLYIANKRKQRFDESFVEEEQKELKPNSMQEGFIESLDDIYECKDDRALLISATGTGKTFASAFAMKHFKFKRVLFLVHRTQLADQTKRSYEKVFGPSLWTGLIGGGHNDYDADYIFATVQTISKDENLNKFKPYHFDCIILDEAHHSSANSYQKIMNYFKPKFWLGMTATPDKRDDDIDGRNIYEIFHHNIAYEIRLQEAMKEDLLCPFHYFGITDLQMIDDNLQNEKTNLSINQLTSDERLRHILEQTKFYGYSGDRVKGLIFCSRIEETEILSQKLNTLGYRTIALNGSASEEERIDAFDRLAMNEADASYNKKPLDYILSVDILNEGVDIVEVNQVIMLRPTQSPIVFIQQLGRGLRKAKGKEYVVILDFIGNYQKNFMIPVALSGDRTYNADGLRRFVTSGTAVIPGSSTIHFDEIAKEKIFHAIDRIKGKKQLIRESYLNLKNRLGEIPRLHEFILHNEIDPLVIIGEYKSYQNFLETMEPTLVGTVDESEKKELEYISKLLIRGLRYYDLVILNDMVMFDKYEKENMIKSCQAALKEDYNQVDFDHALYNLNGNFVSKEEELKDTNTLVVEEENTFNRSDYLEWHFSNEQFWNQLGDIVTTGFFKFDQTNESKEKRIAPFILYEKYSRRDVCYLMNMERDFSSTMYGMYADAMGENVYIFVTYHKIGTDDEKKNYAEGKPDYADRFESDDEFHWDSQIGKGIESPYMKKVRNAKKKHLFVKKSDNETSFYYMGTFKIVDEEESTKLDNKQKNQKITKVVFRMDIPVKEDILKYLESNIVLEDKKA